MATHVQIAMGYDELGIQWALQMHLCDGVRLLSGRYFWHPNWLGLRRRPENDGGGSIEVSGHKPGRKPTSGVFHYSPRRPKRPRR